MSFAACLFTVVMFGLSSCEAQVNLLTLWRIESSGEVSSIAGASVAFDQVSGIGAALTIEASSAFVALRGFNYSNGQVLWEAPTNCSNSDPVFLQFVESSCGVGLRAQFVLGCDEALYFFSLNGRVSFVSPYPLAHRLTVMEQSSPSGGPQKSFLYVPLKKMLILSVSTASNEFGTLLFDVATCAFTSQHLLGSCKQERVSSVFAADDPGFFQVCSKQSILFRPFSASDVFNSWTFMASNLSNPTSVGCASTHTVLVVAWQCEEVQYVLGFAMSNDAPVGPMWSFSSGPSQGPILAVWTNEVVALQVPQVGLYGINFTNGNVLWQTPLDDTYPRALTTDAMYFPDLVFMATYQDVLTFNITDGSLLATVPFNCASGHMYGIGVPLSWNFGSFNGSDTYRGESIRALAFVGEECIQLYDPNSSSMIGQVLTDEGPIQAPQVLNLSGELDLVVVKSDAITMMSLNVGWEVQHVSSAMQQESVVFVSTTDGITGAIDRNGRFVWKAYATQQVDELPLVFGLLLAVSEEYAIKAYNVFNGSLLATLLVPSDCNASVANAAPTILSGLVANVEGTSAYFAAGLPCLLRVDADLSIHSIPTPWRLSVAPVLDEDNRLAIVKLGKQILSVSTGGDAQSRLIAVLSDESTVDIVPSSRFSPKHDWGKGLNPLLYVVSSTSIAAYDLLAARAEGVEEQAVWTLAQGTIYTHEWFNNSLYTISIAGICKILIGVSVPTTERRVWCHGGYAVESAQTISNIVFSPDGVLLFALDSDLYAIDAYSAAARWSSSGFVALPYYNCEQLSFSNKLFAVLAVCNQHIVAIDAAESPHNSLLYAQTSGAIQSIAYEEPTLFVIAPGEQGSVLGFQLPSHITHRCDFPSDRPTDVPVPITVAPGFVPPPTPLPNTSAAYPTAQQTMSLLATAVGPMNLNEESVASCPAPQDLLPGIVVVAPMMCSNETTEARWCCVRAYNVSIPGGASLFWETEVVSAIGNDCNVANALEVVGTPTCFVVFQFDNVIIVLDAHGGKVLWNSTEIIKSTESIIAFSALELPGAHEKTIVVVVTDLRVAAVDSSTGLLLFAVKGSTTLPSCYDFDCAIQAVQSRVPFGLNSVAVAIASPLGLQVISASLEKLSSASTKLWMNTSEQSSLCATNSIMLAAPSNEENRSDVLSSPFVYAVCIKTNPSNIMVVFRVNVTDGYLDILSTISLEPDEEAPAAFMVERAGDMKDFLFVMTSSLTRIINVTTEAITTCTTSAVYNPALIGTAGRVLLLVGEAGDIMGVDKFTGAVLWNMDTQYFVIPTALNVPAMTARTMGPDTTFISLGIPFVLNTTSGQITWAGQSNNFVTSAVTKWGSGLVAGGASVDTFLITFSAATTSFYAWSTIPLPQISGTQINCFIGAFSLMEEAHGVAAKQVKLIASTYSQEPVMTNFNWSESTIEAAGGLTTVFSPNLDSWLVIVLGTTIAAVYRVDTGELLTKWFTVDVCPLSPQNPNYIVSKFQVTGADAVLFSDGACLYHLNVDAIRLSAVPLTVNDPVDTLSMSSDNQTALLTSAQNGLIVAVDIPSMAIMWINDVLDLYDGKNIKVLMLPYDTSVAREAQQVIATGGEIVVSLFVSSGNVAWLYQAGMAVEGAACLTNDGGAAIVSGSVVVKLSLDVGENVQRVSWIRDIGSSWVIQAVAAPEYSNFLVVTGSLSSYVQRQQNVVMLDITNGNVKWNVSFDNVMFSTITFFDDSFTSQPPTVLIGGDPYNNIYVIEVATGQLLYSVAQGLQSGSHEHNGFVVLNSGEDPSVYDPLCLSMVARSQSPPLPSVSPAPPPIIPHGYNYVMPLPSSSVASPPPAGVPYPLLSWQFLPDTQSNWGFTDNGFWTTMDGFKVFLMVSYNVSDTDSETARIVAVNAVSGEVILSLPMWSSNCRPRWMAKLNARFVALACHDNTDRLVVVDASTSQFTAVAAIALPGEYSEFTLLSMEINDAISCIYSAVGQAPSVLLCVNLTIDSPNTDPDTIAFDAVELANLTAMFYQCPQQAPLVNTPRYSKAANSVLVPCSYGVEGTYGLESINPSTGDVVWSATWDYYYNSGIGPMFVDAQQELCAVMIPNQYYNWSLQLFRVVDGAVEVNLTLPCLGDNNAQFLLMKEVINETVSTGREYLFVFAVQGSLVAYSSATGEPVWTHDDTEFFSSYSPLVALLYDDNLENSTLILIASTMNVDTLFAFDLLGGAPVFNITSQTAGSYDNALDLVIMNNGSNALSVYDNYQYYYDLRSRELLMMNPGSLFPGGYLDLSAAGGPQLFDLAEQTGTISQFVIQGSRSVPRMVDHFTTVMTESGQTFVVASSGMSTYMINASGFQVWGTTVQDTAQHHVFDPALFTVSGRTILVKSAHKRSFYGFDANNGSLLYAGSLPLCKGDGAPMNAVVGSAADQWLGVMYVTVGNQCLYRIDALTGQVSVYESQAPLVSNVLISPHCVVTVSSFGSIVCRDRASMETMWKISYGYVQPVSDEAIQVHGGSPEFVLVTLGDRLVCIMEETGQVLWEMPVGPYAAFEIHNSEIYLVSCNGAALISLDPRIALQDRLIWTISSDSLFGVVPECSSPLLPPTVTADGSILVTSGQYIAAIEPTTGSLVFRVTASAPCAWVYAPPVLPAGAPTNNVFFSSCGHTDVRSVANGTSIAVLGGGTSDGQSCNGAAMHVLEESGWIVFCDVNNGMTMEDLPSFVSQRAPVVSVVPPSSPVLYPVPPGFTPQGIQTPAPTYPSIPATAQPDLSCALNIASMYVSLATCLARSVDAANNASIASGGRINCSATANSVGACTSAWLSGAACVGAVVYLNTVLTALNHSQAVPFCGSAASLQCMDGTNGVAALCGAINAAAVACDGQTFPTSLLSRLPHPIDRLPAFQPSAHPSESSPSDGMSTGAICGIIFGVLVATALTATMAKWMLRRRQNSKQLIPAPLLHEGPVSFSSRTESELGSVSDKRSSRRLLSTEDGLADYSSVN